MNDPSRTNQELLEENAFLQQSIQRLEISRAEYRLAEEALRESYVARYSLTGIMLFASDAMYYVTGYKPEEIIGTSGFERVHPDDRFQVQSALTETIKKDVSNKVEYRAVCKDGEYKWVEISAKIVHNDQTGQDEVIAAVRNITKRKQAEEALQAANAYNRSLIEASIDPLVTISHDGKITDVNAATERVTGYTRDVMVGTDFSTYFSDPEKARIGYRQAFTEGYVRDYPLEISHRYGHVTPVLYNATLYHNEKGEVSGIFAAARDITERRRAEEALCKAEEKFRSIFENAVEGIFQTNMEGRFISANPALALIFGYESPEDMMSSVTDIGKQLDVYPEQRTERLRLLDEKGFIENYQAQMYRKDGSVLWASINVLLVRDDDVNPCCYEGFVTDITTRKQVEDALMEKTRFLGRILESTPNLIYIYDLFEQRNLFTNREIVSFLGYSSEQIHAFGSALFQNILHPDDAPLVAKHHAKCAMARDHEILVIEYRMKHADGQWHWLYSRDIIFSRNQKGEVQQILGIAEDITERKRTEEALRKAEENYRSIFENAIEGIFQITPDGHYISVNPTFARMFGYDSPDDIMSYDLDIGRQLYVNQEQRKEYLRLLDEKGVINNYEAQMRRKDGNVLWVSVNTRVVRNGVGNPMYFEGFVVDITERKHADEELKKSDELEKSILKSVPHGLFGVENRIIFFANTAMESVFGWKPEELIGKSTRILFRNEDEWKEYGANLYSWLRKKPLVTFDSNIPFVRKDGKEILCRISVSRIGEELGITNRVVATYEDITDRTQSEKDLLESEERYRMIFNHSPLGVMHFDSMGVIVDVNEKFEQIMGAPREKLLGLDMLGSFRDQAMLRAVKEALGGVVGYYEGDYLSVTGGKTTPMRAVYKSIITDDAIFLGAVGIFEDITDRKQAEQQLKETLESLRNSFGATVQVLVSAVESRDPYTSGHQMRSADLARAIATEMGLPKERIEGISMAGSIHDIGKMSVPAEILSRPTKLTELEFSLIKEHANKGFEMLKDVESPWPLAEIVYQHHERMDGSGYPRHLKGKEILMEARILSVADVVEAMASHRPYRPAIGLNAALEELENNRGKLYDSDAVDACLRLFREKGFQLEGDRF